MKCNYKNYRKIFHIILVYMLLLNLFNPIIFSQENNSIEKEKPSFLERFGINFNQYIEMDVDTSVLNQTIDIDQSINLPILFTFWTDIHSGFLSFIPGFLWKFKNKLIYGMQMPQQKLYINITKKPEWANVYIMSRNISINAPRLEIPNLKKPTTEEKISDLSTVLTLSKDSYERFYTSLIISPLEEAPAQQDSIDIEITCGKLGTIQKAVYYKSIPFFPSFSSKIEIKPKEPVRIVGPHQSVNFDINVSNYGNKKVRVIAKITNENSNWKPTINPSFIDVDSKKSHNFSFSVITPYEFGWHDLSKEFHINFSTRSLPLNDNNPIDDRYHVVLSVNNYGFSIPGFELIYLIFGIGLIFYLRKKEVK